MFYKLSNPTGLRGFQLEDLHSILKIGAKPETTVTSASVLGATHMGLGSRCRVQELLGYLTIYIGFIE